MILRGENIFGVFMFEIINFLEFFTFIAGVSIAVYVFSKNPKSTLHIALAMAALGMAGWNLSVFSIMNELTTPIFGSRMAFTWAVLTGIGFTWFVYQYPTKVKFYKILTSMTLMLGVIFIIITLVPNFILDAVMPGGYVIVDMHPVLYPLWTIFFVGNFLYTFILLVVRAIRSSGLHRSRLVQIIWGFLLFFIPSQLSNLLLPFLFNDFRWNNLGPVFTIFLIAFLVNGVLRYRLLDIRWIVGRSVLFSILVSAVLWIVASTVLLISDLVNQNIAVMAAAFLIVLFFKPISKGLEVLFAQLMQNGRYDPAEATEEILDIVRINGELEPLSKKLLERFNQYFSTTEIAIIAFQPGTRNVLGGDLKGFKRSIFKHTHQLSDVAEKNHFKVIETGELKWTLEYQKDKINVANTKNQVEILERAGVSVVVPFIVEGRLVGILLFGKRRYEKMLRSRDVNFLDMIRNAISPALENAAKLAEIQALYDELSELDKVKSEFISVVSHSFRTPLSAIRWNIENVLETFARKLSLEAKSSLSDAHTKTIFLIKTLEHLLETIAFESGKLPVEKKDFKTKAALKSLLDNTKLIMKKKGITFSSRVSDQMIYADQRLITQITETLLLNAAQYTKSGGSINLTVSPKNGYTVIRVVDTGIGIPLKDQEKIFDKFYRAKNARLMYTDGQGMGMYLCKKIVDMHHGWIEVDSIINKGTSMTIVIPSTKEEAESRAKESGK